MSTIQHQTFKILENHNLNWKVEKEQLFAADGRATNYFSIVRQPSNFGGKVDFATCQGGYVPAQNFELVEKMVEVANRENIEITKAGPLNEGRKIFLQMRLPDAKVGNDTLSRYITGLNSHDKSTGLSVGVGNTVASCTNKFYQFNKKNQIRMRHTASLEENLQHLPQLIKTVMKSELELIETFKRLADTRVSMNFVNDVMVKFTGVDTSLSPTQAEKKYSTKKLNIAQNLAESINEEMKGKGQTLWGLWNGITHYTNHKKSVPRRHNARIEALMCGTHNDMNNQALAMCVKKIPAKTVHSFTFN